MNIYEMVYFIYNIYKTLSIAGRSSAPPPENTVIS